MAPAGYHSFAYLGGGTYGSVYDAQDASGARYAIKCLRDTPNGSEGGAGSDCSPCNDGTHYTTIREIGLLHHVLPPHPNIIKLLEVFAERAMTFLVFELMHKTLRQSMKERAPRSLDYASAQNFTRQLTDGVAHCHKLGVAHRDLKPEVVGVFGAAPPRA